MKMNFTEVSDAVNAFSTNQTRSPASDDYSDGNTISLAARIFNGIIISILFKFGIASNALVLHVLRTQTGILLKNTSVILINLMIADLICCLVVLPSDFAFYVLQYTFPRTFKVFFVLKTVMIFLNCSFTIVLSIERFITATYVGNRRGNHLSKLLILCLLAIWLSSLGDATITYYTFKDRNQLPWKLPGLANSASSRCPSAGTVIAVILVLAAILTILFSLYRIRSFLHVVKQDTANGPFDHFSKRLTRMHKRINLACLVSLATLAVSYLPMVTANLLWYSLERQSSDFNAIAEVFCSVAHTVNPLIAISLSRRIQSALLKVLNSLCQSHTLRRRKLSLFGMLRNASSRTNREITRIAEDNVQENQYNSPISSKSCNESSIDVLLEKVIAANYLGYNSIIECNNRVTAEKRRLTKQYSTPVGRPSRTNLFLKKTFSGQPSPLTPISFQL